MGGKKFSEKEKRDHEKAEQKRKERIVEDKTFGLKNKNRSAQVQKKVSMMENQIKKIKVVLHKMQKKILNL